MKKPLFAYKHGDVPRGDWNWAVGAEANMGAGTLCVAVINFHGAIAAGHDPEVLAQAIAEALNA